METEERNHANAPSIDRMRLPEETFRKELRTCYDPFPCGVQETHEREYPIVIDKMPAFIDKGISYELLNGFLKVYKALFLPFIGLILLCILGAVLCLCVGETEKIYNALSFAGELVIFLAGLFVFFMLLFGLSSLLFARKRK